MCEKYPVYKNWTNAFPVMTNAQREQAKKSLPDLFEEPRNNKQKLRNDIINFLREKQCQWKGSEVLSLGSSLVQALTDSFGQSMDTTIYSTRKASFILVLPAYL